MQGALYVSISIIVRFVICINIYICIYGNACHCKMRFCRIDLLFLLKELCQYSLTMQLTHHQSLQL